MIKKKSSLQHIITALSLLGGVVTGLSAPALILSINQEIASLFMNVLKLLSAPMIFLAIVSTLTQIESLKTVKLLIKKVLKYTILTTVMAAVIGLLLFLLINPKALLTEGAKPFSLNSPLNYFGAIKAMVPDNLIKPFLNHNVIAIALIAVALSIGLSSLPNDQSKVAKAFFKALFQALLFLTSKLMLLIPLAIFAFTAQFTASLKEGASSLTPILWYALCVLGANLVQGIILLPLLLKAKRQSPLRLAKGMMPALMVAFLSKSSTIALPVSLECAISRLKMSNQTARFCFPLCSVINMNGCAAFILITTLFVCGSYGITFTFWQMGLAVVIATVAAIGNAGIPMGCFFLTSALLIGMGVPLDLMGVILPLYALFDMVETALNVWSDSCVTSLVDQEINAQDSPIKQNDPLLEPKRALKL